MKANIARHCLLVLIVLYVLFTCIQSAVILTAGYSSAASSYADVRLVVKKFEVPTPGGGGGAGGGPPVPPMPPVPPVPPTPPVPQPGCSDGIMSGSETDVDCGGSCAPCPEGKLCDSNSDCMSGDCETGVCSKVVTPTIEIAAPQPVIDVRVTASVIAVATAVTIIALLAGFSILPLYMQIEALLALAKILGSAVAAGTMHERTGAYALACSRPAVITR